MIKSLYPLRKAMRQCQQTATQNVLQHGISVAKYYKDLHDHLFNGTPLKYQWCLPQWIYDPIIKQYLLDYNTIITYLIYHDCGKPFCHSTDDAGHHFKDHAKMSHDIWLQHTGNTQQALLMLYDMNLHTMNCDQIDQFCHQPEAITSAICALCALHSNSEMFGGTQSTSFKIKYKKLERNAKRIISFYKNSLNTTK